MRKSTPLYGLCCIFLQIYFVKRALSGPVTENSIVNSNSIYSSRFPINLQHNHPNHHHPHHQHHLQHLQFGVDKPSKLRLYLLADLAKAAAAAETVQYINCESNVDLKINTKNCTCANYACHRYYKTVKKPRIFERSCEDVCCSKQRIKGKSLHDGEVDKKIVVRSATSSSSAAAAPSSATAGVVLTTVSHDRAPPMHPVIGCGEIIPDNGIDKLTIPWMVQISSSEGQNRCIGNLLSSRAVITSLNCIDKTNKMIVTRFNESNVEAEPTVIKEIIQDDLVEKSVILVLDEPIAIANKKMSPCLPQAGQQRTSYPACYLGLPNRVATRVRLMTKDDCDKALSGVQTSRNNICVRFDLSEEQTHPGAPLVCNWDAAYPNNYQIIGVLSEQINDILVFDDINRIEHMIKLNLNILM